MATPTADDLRALRVSETFDTPGNNGRLSFVVLAEMRSGGTLIGDLLHRRNAGMPIEYLNPNYRRDFCARLGLANGPEGLADYMGAIRKLRTSANGHFGIHCLFRDLLNLGPTDVAPKFLRGFDRVVVLTRRDKLAQALSAMRAMQTGRWESGLAATTPKRERLDVLAVSAQIHHSLRIGRSVAAILPRVDRPKLFIEYEQVRDSLETVWRDVQAFLDLDPVPAADLGSGLQRQADALSEEFARRYLDAIRGRSPRGR